MGSGIAWTWDARRGQYYFHNFLTEQPDFNFHNPEVQDYMLGTMRFWLDRGVDGFRLDTVNFYFHDLKLRNNPPLSKDAEGDLVAFEYDELDEFAGLGASTNESMGLLLFATLSAHAS